MRLSQDFPHIAAQVTPEEGRNLDTERARDYLQKAFGQADVAIYWGTVDDLLRDLCDRAGAGLVAVPAGSREMTEADRTARRREQPLCRPPRR